MLLFHGTTKLRWTTPVEKGDCRLYVVASQAEADSYASESGEAEWDESIHIIGELEPELIVLKFDLEDIKRLVEFGDVELEPDWGWADQVVRESGGKHTPTWEESLAAVGSFCIFGFSESHKTLAIVIEPETVSYEM